MGGWPNSLAKVRFLQTQVVNMQMLAKIMPLCEVCKNPDTESPCSFVHCSVGLLVRASPFLPYLTCLSI